MFDLPFLHATLINCPTYMVRLQWNFNDFLLTEKHPERLKELELLEGQN